VNISLLFPQILQFCLNYAIFDGLCEKFPFEVNYAKSKHRRISEALYVMIAFRLGRVELWTVKLKTLSMDSTFFWRLLLYKENFLCAKIVWRKFPSPPQTKIWLLTCDSSLFLATMTFTIVTLPVLRSEKQTCCHMILK